MPEVIHGSRLMYFLLAFLCLTGHDISKGDLYIIMKLS